MRRILKLSQIETDGISCITIVIILIWNDDSVIKILNVFLNHNMMIIESFFEFFQDSMKIT